MRKMFILVGFILLLLTAVIGCGNTSSEQPSASPAEKNTVIIQDYAFQPAEISIKKGETITWTNRDSVKHTATGDSFDSGLLGKGESFTQAFDKTGTFDYICTPHPYMKGKISVEE